MAKPSLVRKCYSCIGQGKAKHRLTRVEDYRVGIYVGIWAFYECPARHVTAWTVTEREYHEMQAELAQAVLHG